MKPLISRSCISLSLACLLFAWAGVSPVAAQPESAPDAESGSELPAKGDIIYMRNEAGEPIPVRKNAWVEKYLKWRESQENAPEGQLPQYSIDRLTLTGVANDRLVNLEAVLTIRIRKQTGAVIVPLQFNEAVLKDVVHTGDGDLAFNGLNNNTGYEWKISGEGTHELRLKLSVPVTRQLSSSRLQLRLPPTAVGSLELEVGMRDAAFKTPARTAFKITPRGNATAITLFGLTENLDLTWQPAPESRDAHPVLQADTTIETRIATDYVLLTAIQRISAASGSFQQLDVHLPKGYELQSVTAKQENLLESYTPIEGRPDWYRLQLASPATGPDPVSFEWKLSRQLPEPGAALIIDGFELGPDVRPQSGRLYLSELPGYRLQVRDDEGLFRTDVPPEKLPQFSRAFEFFRQPFSLVLELQKIQSLYSLDPRFELHVERDSLTWKADLNLSVQRGSVSQLTLEWPEWRAAGWKFLDDEQSEIIERIDVDRDDPSIRHVVFQRPLSGENFKLSLEAVRPLTDREASEGVVLQLPRFPKRSVNGATELLITSRSDLDVTLLDTGILETLPDLPPKNGEVSDVVRRLRIPEFAQPQLALSVVPRERIVNVTTNVVAELQEDEKTVVVRQSFDYDVRFEGIGTLRLRIPAAIRESLTASDENGNPLHLEFAEGTGEILTAVRIALPEPRTGAFTILFRFEQKVPDSAAGNIENLLWTLPLIQSSEASARLVTLELGPSLSELYEPDPDDWQQTGDADEAGTLSYTAPGEAVRQEIAFRHRRSPAADGLVSVERSLHVTRTDDDGLIHTRSDFLLNGQFESLTLRLPENYELDDTESIELNGRPIPREARQLSDRTLVVTPSGNAIQTRPLEQRLSVPLVSTEAVSLTWKGGTLSCEAPQLIEANRFQQTFPLASQRSQQTYWLVQLPPKQHLFLQPDGYSPEYLWQRQRLFWSRVPRMSTDELARWIHGDPQQLQDLLSAGGHAYLFSRFGTEKPLTLGTMHLQAVVLAGALLTILISFMLSRLPATRNALTLLVIASVLAFLGVWYPTAVALLLQPAILGFCLAIVAAMLDYLFRRPQLPAVVTFEEPTAGSSQTTGLIETVTPLSQIDLGLGSEEPTQMQQREAQEEHVSSHLSNGE